MYGDYAYMLVFIDSCRYKLLIYSNTNSCSLDMLPWEILKYFGIYTYRMPLFSSSLFRGDSIVWCAYET